MQSRGIGLPQGENLDSVQQSGNTQLPFPWDEER